MAEKEDFVQNLALFAIYLQNCIFEEFMRVFFLQNFLNLNKSSAWVDRSIYKVPVVEELER